ncbi:MAG TPA: glycosyltransferase, partial [Candidatus Latescibacteria bacterium]|nr:glycosyltransferase [Candidatus Latescibacterota bacterium]
MTESSPLVSVVMPTHNSASHGFLRPAIESILGQTWKDLELIIVDDGSVDGTPDFVRQEYASDARIKLFELEHVNQANARNYGVAHSS